MCRPHLADPCVPAIFRKRSHSTPLSAVIFALALAAASAILTSCGVSSRTSPVVTPSPTPTPTPTPSPSSSSYPSTPPVPITWSPSTSPLPAPTAVAPQDADWGKGSNDFPLTVSNPTQNASLTSPINVVASATPTNPIFFMRVYVDQLAVYFTFNNSINTQIFLAPGRTHPHRNGGR